MFLKRRHRIDRWRPLHQSRRHTIHPGPLRRPESLPLLDSNGKQQNENDAKHPDVEEYIQKQPHPAVWYKCVCQAEADVESHQPGQADEAENRSSEEDGITL